MPYATVVIDPPWPIALVGHYRSRSNRPQRLPYQTMSVSEIAALPIHDLLAKGGHAYVWATNSTLRAAFDLLDSWGLSFHLVLVTVKPSGIAPSRGYVFATEFCLLAFNGRPMLPFRKMGRLNWLRAVSGRGRHSSKPDAFYDLITEVSPGPYADIFARKSRLGWHVWGNEVESNVEWPVSPDGSD